VPEIRTLIPDIQELVTKKGGWFSDQLATEFGLEVGARVKDSFGERENRGLRLSGLGPKCPRHLWYSIHHPELAEPMPPWAEVKFAFGHMIEALAIALAKAAGHTVEGEQNVLTVDGVTGHRDCVIDGCVVDVKSASSISFKKFKDKTLKENDSFGYLDQLDGYLVGSSSDPLVRVKDKGYLFAIDKQLGHMCLYPHEHRPGHIERRIEEYKRIVAAPKPPACTCGTVADGKSGNIKLDVRASYSPFKYCCFPNLRTFLYANGPVFLTQVVRRPDVPEIDKNGNFVDRFN